MTTNSYAGITFKDASNRDISKIKKLIQSVLKEYQLTFDDETTDSDLNDIESSYHQNNGFFGVILNDDSQIIGTYGLFDRGGGIAEIRKMYLLGKYRGLGIGKRSLELLIEMARKKGYSRLEIETASVLDAAIKLYEKFGFESYTPQKMEASRCDTALYLNLNK